MKTASLLGALLLCAACPASALAQSADDLKNDQQTPGDVLVYGMGYSGQRYSPLTRIDKSNVGQLVPKWAYSINELDSTLTLLAWDGVKGMLKKLDVTPTLSPAKF